ncbi:hypothetical protein MKZ02_20015 [Pseudobacillus sp. FSL P4-0506]|uniref:hypothetical protein n=1 Tax=Pseudobacillus sp. FSL P4-0506 TaxID=2921576 RepID=UPI0030F8F7BA
MTRYYNYEEAVKIMETGQIMGGGADFDYYFMLNDKVRGGWSCNGDIHEVDEEREKEKFFYVIDGMTNERYAIWWTEGIAEFVPLSEWQDGE